MAVMLGKLYTALRAAKVSETAAREAAEKRAGYEKPLRQTRKRHGSSQVDDRHQHRHDAGCPRQTISALIPWPSRIRIFAPHLFGQSFHETIIAAENLISSDVDVSLRRREKVVWPDPTRTLPKARPRELTSSEPDTPPSQKAIATYDLSVYKCNLRKGRN